MRLLIIVVAFVSILSNESRAQTEDPEEIIDPIEDMASFPGGNDSLKSFVENNLIRPISDFKTGRVFVSFIVDKDGKLSDFEIVRGLSETCDAEALRVARKMPDWIPGIQMGIPVKQKFIISIKFD